MMFRKVISFIYKKIYFGDRVPLNYSRTTLRKTNVKVISKLLIITTLRPSKNSFITNSRPLEDFLKNYLGECLGHLKFALRILQYHFKINRRISSKITSR